MNYYVYYYRWYRFSNYQDAITFAIERVLGRPDLVDDPEITQLAKRFVFQSPNGVSIPQ